jgi:hypothetical protein
MLKITYSDSGILIEPLALTVEAVVAQRTMVALRISETTVIEPARGSLLLSGNLPEMAVLVCGTRHLSDVEVEMCDLSPDHGQPDWWEVTLYGTWIGHSVTAAEGILLAELDPAIEQQILRLWQQSQRWLMPGAPQPLPKAS